MSERADFGIVIPTKNEEIDLPRLLQSIGDQCFSPERVVVVDNASSDATVTIARSFGASVIEAGPNQSTQRNVGSRALAGRALYFIDADMELESGLLDEIASLLETGVECIVVPERTIAEDWLGRARAFERDLFEGDASIESARVFSSRVFLACGGYDTAITGGEDWLLSERARAIVPVARTRRFARHYEGRLALAPLWRKYIKYGRGYFDLYRAGPGGFVAHTNPFRKSILSNWRVLVGAPTNTLCLIAFKLLTYTAGAIGFALAALSFASSRAAKRS